MLNYPVSNDTGCADDSEIAENTVDILNDNKKSHCACDQGTQKWDHSHENECNALHNVRTRGCAICGHVLIHLTPKVILPTHPTIL